MDNSCCTPASAPGSNGGSAHGSVTGSTDEVPRVKFLCSFLGSILPRPQDGKLRYVGGETRIVSVARDISYEELMNRMKELYEGAATLKYQQPDEDLDALVSVVNYDDVTNMMEEYDKLGSGDGCTRLRIFLFPQQDQDGSMPYVDGDDWETERRYVDALNNLNEGSDAKKCDSPVMGSDETLLAEQFFSALNFDGGPQNQRNGDMPIQPYNLRHLNVSHMDSGHIQQSVHQRLNEIEGSWSPYFSPRQQGYHDPRMLSDLPSSPSSARYRIPFPEIPEKCIDRVPEEYVRQPLNSQPSYEQLTQFSDTVGWVPPGASPGDKAGFLSNMLHGHSVYEGNNVGEQRRLAFNRNQAHLEPLANGIPQVANSCAECHPSRAAYMLNADGKMHHGISPKDQPTWSAHGETHYREAGFSIPHQLNSRVEEARISMSGGGSGRLNDQYVVDGSGMNFPAGQGNFADSHLLHSNYVYHRPCPEFGSEVFHDQVAISSQHMHIPSPEDHGFRYGNYTHPYGGDNVYHLPHGLHQQALWRNIQNPVHGASSYDLSALPQLVNGSVNPATVRNTMDGAARFSAGVENQNIWAEPSQKIVGFDGNTVTGQSLAHHLKLNRDPYGQESPQYFTAEPVQSSHDLLDFSTSIQPVQQMDSSSPPIHSKSASGSNQELGNNSNIPGTKRVEEKVYPEDRKEVDHLEGIISSDVQSKSCLQQKKEADRSDFASNQSSKLNCTNATEVFDNTRMHDEKDPSALESEKLSVNRLSFLPELIASVKKAALEEVEDVKVMADDSDSVKPNVVEKAAVVDEAELVNAHGELELDSDIDNHNLSKIEPTKAEEEAISRGLQTIRNDDLEEIRELGSGTYGAVYHGKWKGSDVAIKRIKASCFAGRPSERERLIADFWKEALILSSLHHPNVVSFYGIVRDGPDGSLATVTEFMVNGSLKQFLHKKDRTIDRRKRLIIAMDAAFGMEYLHGKNIVHFDLKCENLLVNMRDPQRPVCKIGDLGLSKVRQHTLVSGGVRGTLPWMAPELLSGKSNMVTEKIDVYSFGIVMWELLTGEEPYADMHCASIIGGIVNNTLRPKIPAWCDPEWKALMEKCWSSDPAERPSFSEISQKLRNMAAAINVK